MNSETRDFSLPRRDLFLLPFISLITVLLLLGCGEFLSRKIWSEKMHNECLILDPVRGARQKANCTLTLKSIEGPWIQYHFNNCGYRDSAPCGPKPAGTLRLAVVGTSVAFGLHVSAEEYFTNRAAAELSRIAGRPIEFQNLGGLGPEWSRNETLLDEIFALKPDAIFFMVMPFDLVRMDRMLAMEPEAPIVPGPAKKTSWTLADARAVARDSRLLFMVQHFLLQDPNFLISTFQKHADALDISREPPPAGVQLRLARMDMLVGKLADRAHSAGIPCYMIAVPNGVEAAIISKGVKLPNLDGQAFLRRMAEIAQRHQVEYIDLTTAIRRTPDAQKLFFAVDGHPTGEAHALIAQVVEDYFRKRGSLDKPGKSAVNN